MTANIGLLSWSHIPVDDEADQLVTIIDALLSWDSVDQRNPDFAHMV